jgi:hypothetical protein
MNINMRTEAEISFLLLGLCLIALILLSAFLLLVCAYFFAGDIFKSLSNSPAVVTRKRTLGWEPIGRFLFILNVGTLLIFFRKSVRSGELNISDYNLFPVGLRRVIEILNLIIWVLSAIGMVGAVVGKFQGWLK